MQIFNKAVRLIGALGVWGGVKHLLLLLVKKATYNKAQISYSDNGEDILIEELFNSVVKDVDKGVYLDIGCYEPVNYSNTFKLYLNGWSGICVDPNKEVTNEFRKIRKKDNVVNAVVSNKDDQGVFYYAENSPQKSTYMEGHKDKFEKDTFVERDIDVKTVEEILHDKKFEGEIHLMDVDVEGAEVNVLKSIDFSSTKPWMIVLELSRNVREIITLLSGHGYEFLAYDKSNGYFVRADKVISTNTKLYKLNLER